MPPKFPWSHRGEHRRPIGLPLNHPRVMSLVSQRVPQVKNLDAAKQLYLNSQEEGVERSTALRVSLPLFSHISACGPVGPVLSFVSFMLPE